MKTITIDGKEYNLVPVEENQERKTGWERVKEDRIYFCFNERLDSRWQEEDYDEYNEEMFSIGNYRSNEELNKNICRAMRLRLKMLQWQALNDEPIKDNEINRFFIDFDSLSGNLIIGIACGFFGDVVYFSSYEKAEEALEIFKDELMWYYTEFYRRLDEKR